MPRILLDGCDTTKIIRQIMVDVKIDFRSDFYKEYPARVHEKMKLLEEQFGEVLKKWFDDYGSEVLSNHEYNLMMHGE